MPRKTKWDKSNHNARGPIKQEDIDYIYQNSGIKSDEDIAAHIKRTPAKVREIRIKHQAVSKQGSIDIEDAIRLREALYAEPEWELIKKSMNKEELSVFEQNFMELMRQFKGDVLPTERKQIISVLNIQIRLFRLNIEENQANKDIIRLRLLLENALDNPKTEDDDGYKAWQELVTGLNNQVNGAGAASKAKADQFKILTEKFNEGIKLIKGGRDQRIEKIEQSKETFVGLLRRLGEEDTRNSVMLENFIVAEGTKAELKRLSSYHTFMDGRVDKPILDSDTVE